ncbi:lkhA [Symbiodinium sp. CCMP2592]|nr:lkhA [Symbiodinium sp. CCMP2592]
MGVVRTASIVGEGNPGFGVTTPSICILCVLAAFPLKRLAGYKLCYAHQRTIPRVQEGIGSWESILTFLAYAGVTVTCYIVVFIFNIWDLTFCQSMLGFVIAERAIGGFKFVVEGFFGAKSVAQKRIEEHNDDVLDEILAKDHEPEKIERGDARKSTRASLAVR